MSGSFKANELFFEETREMTNELEQHLLNLESDPENHDLVDSIFRTLHTIKGSAAMFGFERISGFTHELEALFDSIRQGIIPVEKKIIDLTLESRDLLLSLLDGIESNEEIEDSREGELQEKIQGILKTVPRTDASQAPVKGISLISESGSENETEEADIRDPGVLATYRISFKPDTGLFRRGSKPDRVIKELSELGPCIPFAHVSKIGRLEDLDPEESLTSWTIILSTDQGINAIQDVFIFTEDYAEIKIDRIDDETVSDSEGEYKRIGEILVEQGHLDEETLGQLLEEKQLIGDIAVEKGLISEDKLDSALEEQNYVRSLRKQRNIEKGGSTIRVKNEKLDELVNLVGELVTIQARLSQKANPESDPELKSIAEGLERISMHMRENTMNLRLVPLAELFTTYNRLIRDLSGQTEKEVKLEVSGGDTELDKKIIEMLRDPLLHIIRNAVDHGIEEPEARLAAGKAREGKISIDARYTGANVQISISDDGKGLDPEAIRRKAEAQGLITRDQSLGREEIYNLIFLPGFSTAEKATDLSGRGVGMDVVKRNIEAISGSMEISSEPGKGSTIKLMIPLTLAIIDSLLLSVGEERYVVNLNHVDECFILRNTIMAEDEVSTLAELNGELIPYINLRRLLGIDGNAPEIQNVVVTLVDDGKVAFIVDEILGQTQSVIKSLDSGFKNIHEFSGSTICGDGSISLILDTVRIAKNLVGKYADV